MKVGDLVKFKLDEAWARGASQIAIDDWLERHGSQIGVVTKINKADNPIFVNIVSVIWLNSDNPRKQNVESSFLEIVNKI